LRFERRTRRLGAAALAVTALGAAAATLSANPAAAAGIIAAVTTVSCSVTGANWCISGNNSSSGIGVIGTSKTGTGLRGTSTSQYGLKATSVTGTAILAQTTSGATAITANAGSGGYGISATGGIGTFANGSSYGVYGTTSSTSGQNTGVLGTVAGAGTGVYGFSGGGTGVVGAVASGTGVHGSTPGGIGVQGNSGGGSAVAGFGSGSATGLYASSGSGYGLIAYAGGSDAIYGSNSNGNGADVSGTYIGIIGRAPSTAYPLLLTDANANDVFWVDGTGNVHYHGNLESFTRIATGATVSGFSAKTTLPTVEDTGTAQLVGGTATIRLDPAFAASIDPHTPYRVFLTPGGDTHGLFVATKALNGFIVRETEGGHSTLSFDYRIVATALGQSGQRMAVVDAGSNSGFAPRAAAVPAPKQQPAANPISPKL
jgi:hypothetical protein